MRSAVRLPTPGMRSSSMRCSASIAASSSPSGNPPSTATASLGPTWGTPMSSRNARRSVGSAKPNSASTSSRTWVWIHSVHASPISGTAPSVCSDTVIW